MIRERGALTLRTYHILLHGLPRAGKTCCKMRLMGQKLKGHEPAERRGDRVYYPDNDSSCSTGVAESTTIALVPSVSARGPSASTAIIREVDEIPWLVLKSSDDEVVDAIKRMGEASEKMDTESLGKEEAKLPRRNEVSQPTATPITAVASATESTLPHATLETFKKVTTTAFKNTKHEEIQKVLQKETLVYLIDSGGQPQFQELLPVLVSGPTLFLLTFSLLERLQAEFMVRYTSPEGSRYAYPAKRRVLDVLIECLGSIKCTCSYQAMGGVRVEVKPKVIFVGTMKGLVSEEEFSTIDQELQTAIKVFEDFKDLVVFNGTRLIFPVDSFAEDDGGFASLRMAIRVASSEQVTKVVGGESIIEEVCQATLPSTSVALHLILRSLSYQKLITMKECKKLAAECGIKLEELPHVLWLLQHFIGSIRHYPENSVLQEHVVNSPQLLCDAPTKLLAETFAFEKVELDHINKEKVWKKGVFTMATLRKLWKDDEFTPELLLSFLLHLNIVAPLHEEDTYFMPCALICAPEDVPSNISLQEDSALVCFEGGHTPKGVYGCLLAHLLKKPQTGSFDLEWIPPKAAGKLFSNRAKLSVVVQGSYPFDVQVAVHLKFIEVAVDQDDSTEAISPTQKYLCCHAILHSVISGVKEVIKHLHYNRNATPKEGLFFPCSCTEQCGPHAAYYDENKQLGLCCGCFSKPAKVWFDKWIAGKLYTLVMQYYLSCH